MAASKPLGEVTSNELMELITSLASVVLWQGSAINHLSRSDAAAAGEAITRSGREMDLFIRAVERVADLQIINGD